MTSICGFPTHASRAAVGPVLAEGLGSAVDLRLRGQLSAPSVCEWNPNPSHLLSPHSHSALTSTYKYAFTDLTHPRPG
jgi:hypothetical protein